MAEAIYNQLARRSRAKSTGIDPGAAVKTQALATLSRHGFSCQGLHTKKLTPSTLSSADFVVFLTRHHEGVVAPNSEEWDVPLPEKEEDYEKLFSELRRKITSLVKKVDAV